MKLARNLNIDRSKVGAAEVKLGLEDQHGERQADKPPYGCLLPFAQDDLCGIGHKTICEVERIEAGVSRGHARRAGHEGNEEYHLGLLDGHGPHRLGPSREEDSNNWGCAARKGGSQCKLLWRSGR